MPKGGNLIFFVIYIGCLPVTKVNGFMTHMGDYCEEPFKKHVKLSSNSRK